MAWNRIRKQAAHAASGVPTPAQAVIRPRFAMVEYASTRLALVCEMAKEKGIAVMVVIHDLNLALRYCNRFLLIKNGEVYSYGDISTVTEKALEDVYGIKASLLLHAGKMLAVIE